MPFGFDDALMALGTSLLTSQLGQQPGAPAQPEQQKQKAPNPFPNWAQAMGGAPRPQVPGFPSAAFMNNPLGG
jgi:hypothetical protein